MTKRVLLAVVLISAFAHLSWAQANGKFQIRFMDVGQGDGALLLSPGGEMVLFDDGTSKDCTKPVFCLHSLGITKIDYHNSVRGEMRKAAESRVEPGQEVENA
jgi:beta-lactamase superfamily II metal-dependent hydrolase